MQTSVGQPFSGSQNHIKSFNESLLDLFSRLRCIHPDKLDGEINRGLQFASGFLNFDWCALVEFSDHKAIFNRIYTYFTPSVNLPPVENISHDTQYITEKVRSGHTVSLRHLPKDLPDNAKPDKNFCLNNGLKSSLALPFKIDNTVQGGLYFASLRDEHLLRDEALTSIHFFAEILAGALKRKRVFEYHTIALRRTTKRKKHLEHRSDSIGSFSSIHTEETNIIGRSKSFNKVLKKVNQVARTSASVLLLGETGSGKGVIARAIHNASQRNKKSLIQVNCGGFSQNLIDSELFGHEKGAFTGALSKRPGCFERAQFGTLFLDEISEIPFESQAKLLRVLQDQEFERVGGFETLYADVRLIAASNRDLKKEIEAGMFRRDLWYRLNMYPITIPPLRERPEDIPLFLDHFLIKYSKWAVKSFKPIHKQAIKKLQSYSWPGNIRELENLVARAVIDSPNDVLCIEIPEDSPGPEIKKVTLHHHERNYILQILKDTDWQIEGPMGAAKQLGLHPSTLRLRLKKHLIERPK